MLRKLEMKDAPYMLEWMHDPNVIVGFAKDFSSMRIEDCTRFIDKRHKDRNNIHLAVVGDSDEYMGTVSLKNLNARQGWAEFAISMRTKAMGSGLAGRAIHEIINKGITELCLTDIYWNVFRENQRAIRFYEKNGFRRAGETVEQKNWNLLGVQPKTARLVMVVSHFQRIDIIQSLFLNLQEGRRKYA